MDDDDVHPPRRGPPGRAPDEPSPVFRLIMGVGSLVAVACLVALVHLGSQMERPEGEDGEPMGFTESLGHGVRSLGESASTGVTRMRLYSAVGGLGEARRLTMRLGRVEATASDLETLEAIRDIVGLPESFLENAREGRISDEHARRIADAAGYDGPLTATSTGSRSR